MNMPLHRLMITVATGVIDCSLNVRAITISGNCISIPETPGSPTGGTSARLETTNAYFTKDVVMVVGKRLEIDGKWYYFYAEGSLARNTIIDSCQVDKNGARKTE